MCVLTLSIEISRGKMVTAGVWTVFMVVVFHGTLLASHSDSYTLLLCLHNAVSDPADTKVFVIYFLALCNLLAEFDYEFSLSLSLSLVLKRSPPVQSNTVLH